MVYVRLERDWTDSEGTDHAAGTMVDVDAGTLAVLEASGVVDEVGGSSGPGGEDPEGAGWVGPTGGEDPEGGGWVGPTGGDDPSAG